MFNIAKHSVQYSYDWEGSISNVKCHRDGSLVITSNCKAPSAVWSTQHDNLRCCANGRICRITSNSVTWNRIGFWERITEGTDLETGQEIRSFISDSDPYNPYARIHRATTFSPSDDHILTGERYHVKWSCCWLDIYAFVYFDVKMDGFGMSVPANGFTFSIGSDVRAIRNRRPLRSIPMGFRYSIFYRIIITKAYKE